MYDYTFLQSFKLNDYNLGIVNEITYLGMNIDNNEYLRGLLPYYTKKLSLRNQYMASTQGRILPALIQSYD